jgi:hypothetical protein
VRVAQIAPDLLTSTSFTHRADGDKSASLVRDAELPWIYDIDERQFAKLVKVADKVVVFHPRIYLLLHTMEELNQRLSCPFPAYCGLGNTTTQTMIPNAD